MGQQATAPGRSASPGPPFEGGNNLRAAASWILFPDSRTPLVVYQPAWPRSADAVRAPLRGAASRHRRALARHGVAGRLRRLRSERANPQADVCSGGRRWFSRRPRAMRCSTAGAPSGPMRSRAGTGRRRLLLRRLRDAGGVSLREKVVSAARRPGLGRPARSPMERENHHSRSLASGTMRAVFGYIIQRG